MHTDAAPAVLFGHRITTVGPLRIDHEARTARANGVTLRLRPREWNLLPALASDPSRVFTRAELLRAAWDYRTVGTTRTVDTHACRLRASLREAGTDLLVTVWGVGYRLRDPR